MLRRTLLASAGAMALAGPAFAADLAPPPPVMPPVYNWTGVYAGINAGYHWGGSHFSFTGADTDGGGLGALVGAGAIPTTGVGGASGFIGGGQIGYNYQISSIVLGLELDIDGATGRNSRTTVAAPFGFVPVATEDAQQLNWLGTLRGRIGWTPFDRLLIYGTGGLAFGQSTAFFSATGPAAAPPLFASVTNTVSVGWTVGGGFEYALPSTWFPWSNWSVKVEYLYYDLGRTTGTIFYPYPGQFSSLSGQIRHNGNIVRAGLNYKFNWGAPTPVVAKY